MRESDFDELLHLAGSQIRAARMDRSWTQEQLAQRLGISLKNVQRFEAGGQNMQLRTLGKIAAALGVEPAVLITAPEPTLPSEREADRVAAALARSALDVVDERTLEALDAGGTARVDAGLAPVYDVRAYAGWKRGAAQAEVAAWVRLPESYRRRADELFLAVVTGTSMLPRVPDGAICLFSSRIGDAPLGKVMLVHRRESIGDHDGGSIHLKRVGAMESPADGVVVLRLDSLNPDVPSLRLTAGEGGEAVVIAEFVTVLGSRERRRRDRRASAR